MSLIENFYSTLNIVYISKSVFLPPTNNTVGIPREISRKMILENSSRNSVSASEVHGKLYPCSLPPPPLEGPLVLPRLSLTCERLIAYWMPLV